MSATLSGTFTAATTGTLRTSIEGLLEGLDGADAGSGESPGPSRVTS